MESELGEGPRRSTRGGNVPGEGLAKVKRKHGQPRARGWGRERRKRRGGKRTLSRLFM